MCFHHKQSKDAQTLQNRFNATLENKKLFIPMDYNGFSFPKTPIITNVEPSKIQMYHWGLLPSWTTDISFRKNTLNARVETISEKPSFKNYTTNRCLILVDGFYEWQWLDDKGKMKQKYLMTIPNDNPFALAGLWNIWKNNATNELIETYTILTTQANEQMSVIHNSKKRMPLVLNIDEEKRWLNNENIDPKRTIEFVTTKV